MEGSWRGFGGLLEGPGEPWATPGVLGELLGGALTALLDASGSPRTRRQLQGGDLGALRLDLEGIWEGRRRLSIEKYRVKRTLRVLARILAYGPSAGWGGTPRGGTRG